MTVLRRQAGVAAGGGGAILAAAALAALLARPLALLALGRAAARWPLRRSAARPVT